MKLMEKLRAKFKHHPKPAKASSKVAPRTQTPTLADDNDRLDGLLSQVSNNDYGELGKLIASKKLSGDSRLWAAIARRGRDPLIAARNGCFGGTDGHRDQEAADYGTKISVTEAEHRRDNKPAAPTPVTNTTSAAADYSKTGGHIEGTLDDEEVDYKRSELPDEETDYAKTGGNIAGTLDDEEVDYKRSELPDEETDYAKTGGNIAGTLDEEVDYARSELPDEETDYAKTGGNIAGTLDDDARDDRAAYKKTGANVADGATRPAAPKKPKPKMRTVWDKATPGVRPDEGQYVRSADGTWQRSGTATATTPRTQVLGQRGHGHKEDPYLHEDKVATFAGRNEAKDPSDVPMHGGIDRTAYLDPKERASYAASAAERDGQVLLVGADGKPLDTSEGRTGLIGAAEGRFIFTLSKTGKLYLANAAKEAIDRTTANRKEGGNDAIAFHHTSFLAGGDVLAAGDIEIRGGSIVALSNNSGHYKMGVESNLEALDALAKLGFDVTALRVETKVSKDHTVAATGNAVLQSAGNVTQLDHHASAMEDIRIPGYADGKAGQLLAKQRASEEQSADLDGPALELFAEMTELLDYAGRLGVTGSVHDNAKAELGALGKDMLHYRDVGNAEATSSLAYSMRSCQRAYDKLCDEVDGKLVAQEVAELRPPASSEDSAVT